MPYVKPVTSWVRYAYRFPVRIHFKHLPHRVSLYLGTDVKVFVAR